jgi:hypothetical protein
MDKKLFFLFVLLSAMLLMAACGVAAESAETNQDATEHEDEHMDEHEDEHMDEHEDEHMDEHEDEHMDEHEDEHMDEHSSEHMHVEPPHDFESLENPVAGDSAAIDAGQEIFTIHCETCHGPEGHGDGPGAEGLDPKPANLADADMMHDLSDGYLFWRVSEGGAFEPFNSAMPSWKETLTEDQIWQAIAYLTTLSEK